MLRYRPTLIAFLAALPLASSVLASPALASPALAVPAPFQCGEDSFEDNDTCATATQIVTPFIETGLAVYKVDSDYYALTVQPGDQLIVDILFSHAVADLELRLYDANGSGCGLPFNALSSSTSSSNDESISWTNSQSFSMDLIVKVEVFAGSITPCNNYDISVRVAPPFNPCNPAISDDALEDNDDCGSAVNLPVGSTPNLWVSRDDPDFYGTTLQTGQTLDAQIFFSDNVADLDIFLYRASGPCGDGFGTGELASGFTQTDNERIIWSNTTGAPLNVILHVDVFNGGGSCSDYDMLINFGSGFIGTNFCSANNNSTGMIGLMRANGSPSVSSNSMTVSATQLPPNQFGLFVTGMTPGLVPNAGGSLGNLCLGGDIGRYNSAIGNSGGAGVINLTVNLAAMPQPSGNVSASAGQTWHFQAWHRDMDSNGVPSSNFTNGIRIMMQP